MKYFKHNGACYKLKRLNIKNSNIINILYAKNNIGCGQKQGLRLLSSQSSTHDYSFQTHKTECNSLLSRLFCLAFYMAT